jgi:hypothetical protein
MPRSPRRRRLVLRLQVSRCSAYIGSFQRIPHALTADGKAMLGIRFWASSVFPSSARGSAFVPRADVNGAIIVTVKERWKRLFPDACSEE